MNDRDANGQSLVVELGLESVMTITGSQPIDGFLQAVKIIPYQRKSLLCG